MGACCTKCVRERVVDQKEEDLKQSADLDPPLERATKGGTNPEAAAMADILEFKTKAATIRSHVDVVNVSMC